MLRNVKECDKEHIENIKHYFFVGNKSKAIKYWNKTPFYKAVPNIVMLMQNLRILKIL
jgi:hypothetical protein